MCCLGVVHAPVQSTRCTLPPFHMHWSSQHKLKSRFLTYQSCFCLWVHQIQLMQLKSGKVFLGHPLPYIVVCHGVQTWFAHIDDCKWWEIRCVMTSIKFIKLAECWTAHWGSLGKCCWGPHVWPQLNVTGWWVRRISVSLLQLSCCLETFSSTYIQFIKSY